MSCNNACLLNYDNAPCIPIIAYTDTSIEFSVFFPDPIDLSTGTFSFTLASDERGDCPTFSIAEGDGLTVAAGTFIDIQDPNKPIGQGIYGEVGDTINGYDVSLFIPKDNGLRFGDYYGQVRHDVDSEHASIILKTSIQIQSSIARL